MLDIEARLVLLKELGERLARRREELVAAAGEDMGAPCAIAGLEVDLAADYLKTMEVEAPNVTWKSPYGTVAAIFPYDAPPIMLARVGGTGVDNRTFGEDCVRDPEVRVFFVSGGGQVGAAYARKAQAFDKLIFAGPSGLPPVILFRDAPLEQAAVFMVRRAFINGGQYCTTLKRAYIHQAIYPKVKERVLAMMPEILVGDPQDSRTWIGPLKVARTRALLDRALEAVKGHKFLWPYRRDGEWQGPFLVETLKPPDVELFGPFLALCPVADDQEAVEKVLRSRYPFLVAFFGTPPPRAKERFASTFGMVYDNPDFLFTPLRLPFGGRGESGWILENQGGQLIKRDGAFIYSEELVK